MQQFLADWGWVVSGVVSVTTVAVDVAAAVHLALYKRDSRAAIGWMGVILLAPLVGAVLYFLFGVNRIRRKALRLRPVHPPRPDPDADPPPPPAVPDHLAGLDRLVRRVTGRPLAVGNRVTPIRDGDRVYAEMTTAIRGAERTVGLCTYIFDNDAAGRLFVDALGAAVARGVAVRVLVDDVGRRYSWPSIVGRLRRAGVPVARFLPQLLPWQFPYANLRNHRKLLTVDGRAGFTGGMNIRAGHAPSLAGRHPIHDLHFKIEGPVVGQLQQVFAGDWAFTTGELLDGDGWFPVLPPAGEVAARAVASGPDRDFEKLRTTLLGALASARRSVRVLTPYFLPDAGLTAALNVAALRGVEVDVLIPERSNLRLVQWASNGQLDQVLGSGCRVWFVPPPFDHAKLMLVDGEWTLLGSGNWDPRSLELNFELDVECYDPALAGELEDLVAGVRQHARRVTVGEWAKRGLAVRLRDGVARLFAPYL